MRFEYVVFTQDGARVDGTIEAPNEHEAERALWDWGYQVATLRAKRTLPRLDGLFPSVFGARSDEVIAFSRQLATLVDAGIAVLPGLRLLQQQASRPFARVLAQLGQAIEHGTPLSEATREHPLVFPPIYSQLLAVGERTGELEVVLRQAATHMEKDRALVRRVRGALAYPLFILVMAIGVIAIVVTFALPPLIALFDEFDSDLPLTTRLLLAITGFVNAYRVWIGVTVVASGGLAGLYFSRPLGRRQLDRALLSIPRVGAIARLSNAARFGATASMLLRAGVPISDVMDLAIDTTGNRVVRERMREAQAGMLDGQGLSAPLGRIGLFPPMFVQMVAVGEETGTLDNALETMATLYTAETDERITALTSLIQPVLLLGVAGMVAFIAFSVITPMYQLLQAIDQP